MRTLLLLFPFLFFACDHTPRYTGEKLQVLFDKTPLRTAPGEKSPEMRQLMANEQVSDLGTVSRFRSNITLQHATAEEPWISVETVQGDTGWVFAAAVAPLHSDDETRLDWLRHKRLDSYLGKILANRVWQHFAKAPPNSDADMAAYFGETLQLRDTINLILQKSISVNTEGRLPDLFWLDDLSNLWLLQSINDGKGYHLFFDYKLWLQQAKTTTGLADDVYFSTCCAVFPTDSIESFFPVWVMPIDEQHTYSNLGAGKHKAVLHRIGKALQHGELFKPALKKMKDRILEDFLQKNAAFWQPQTLAVQELQAIIDANYPFFSPNDNIALATKLTILEDAAGNGIWMDLRAK